MSEEINETTTNNNNEVLWKHQADRTIWELAWICMKGKCRICKYFYGYIYINNNKQQQP